MKSLIRVWRLTALLALGLLGASPWLVPLWVKGVELPWLLSGSMALYVLLFTWGTPFVTFINGVGKVRLQLLVSMVGGLLNLPMAIWLAQAFGSSGVILATILCLSYGYLFAPIQYKKIIRQTANGIWNR
jgi:O-antigen/teichoic acid export membrane protein